MEFLKRETPKTSHFRGEQNRTQQDPQQRHRAARPSKARGEGQPGGGERDLQGVGGELPPVASRHGGRRLLRRGPGISGAAAALVGRRREIPSAGGRGEKTLARAYGLPGSWLCQASGEDAGVGEEEEKARR